MISHKNTTSSDHCCYVNSVLQVSRGNRGNLGIISLFSIKGVVTSHWNRLIERVLMGVAIYVLVEKLRFLSWNCLQKPLLSTAL